MFQHQPANHGVDLRNTLGKDKGMHDQKVTCKIMLVLACTVTASFPAITSLLVFVH
jgi:hypothetical protein